MTTLRSDAARNRERLLTAASVVFAQRGLDAGVEEIAQHAGVGIGTLYRRFPTKDALIAELVRELLTEVLTQARAALDEPDGAGLVGFLYRTAEAQATHRGCLARLWNDDETGVLRGEIRAVLGRLLRQAQEYGQVRDDADIGDLYLIFWSLPGVIEATDGLETAWRRHLALVVAGLRPAGATLADPPLTATQLRTARNRAVLSGR